jgi:hypothetical protein
MKPIWNRKKSQFEIYERSDGKAAIVVIRKDAAIQSVKKAFGNMVDAIDTKGIKSILVMGMPRDITSCRKYLENMKEEGVLGKRYDIITVSSDLIYQYREGQQFIRMAAHDRYFSIPALAGAMAFRYHVEHEKGEQSYFAITQGGQEIKRIVRIGLGLNDIAKGRIPYTPCTELKGTFLSGRWIKE